MATELQHRLAEEINIEGCSPSCSQLWATSWTLPHRDNVERTLVRSRGLLPRSLPLGGILLIFTVIFCPTISLRDLTFFPLATVGFCYPSRPHPAGLGGYCQKKWFVHDARCIQLQDPLLMRLLWMKNRKAERGGEEDDEEKDERGNGEKQWMKQKRMMRKRTIVREKRRVQLGKGKQLLMPLFPPRKFSLGAASEGTAGNWCYLA